MLNANYAQASHRTCISMQTDTYVDKMFQKRFNQTTPPHTHTHDNSVIYIIYSISLMCSVGFKII